MEQGTALALLVIPLAVGQLFFGCAELTGVVISVAQVTGIVLIALGVACWPPSGVLCEMLTYGSLATVGLLYLALRGTWVGPLLWPAVVLHAILTLLFARGWFKPQAEKAT